MRLEEFVRQLNLNEATAEFVRKNGFEEAEQSFVSPPAGLTEICLRERLALLHCRFDSETLFAAAATARQSEILQHLFHFLSYYWWHRKKVDLYFYHLPEFTQIAGETDGALLDLALVLDSIQSIRAKFAAMGIPDAYAMAALERINRSVADYQRFHGGRVGYSESQHHWMRHFVNGEVFRIGRLEYMIADPPAEFPLENGPIFLRRKKDGAILGLCRDGWKLNREGLQLWHNDPPETAAVTALINRTVDTISGIPVNPAGFAEISHPVTLSLKEYELVWQKGDCVPDIHIPGGGGLVPELCRQSLAEAVIFFKRYLQQDVKGFTSFSWIYNPDLAQVMPDSNLAAFMRQLYLSPCASGGRDGLGFVFGKSAGDWSDFPRETSMQRAFHRLRESGRRLKEAGMFIESRGITHFGNALYRREYEEQYPQNNMKKYSGK